MSRWRPASCCSSCAEGKGRKRRLLLLSRGLSLPRNFGARTPGFAQADGDGLLATLDLGSCFGSGVQLAVLVFMHHLADFLLRLGLPAGTALFGRQNLLL